MDLAAIAIPAGFRSDRLPFGVSLIAPAFSDEALLSLAERYLGETTETTASRGGVRLAVVGAHLAGQPLNHELTSRGARLVKTCRTAADYLLFALDTTPAKPGLIREPGFNGTGMEVEVWSVPENKFGSFVANVPAPLSIGTVILDDGSAVKGFLCETAALANAREITRFGGWRNYLSSAR
jgi:allophanate hydrolase